MEERTKICKQCGRELPLVNFTATRWGGHMDICRECVTEKRRNSRYSNAQPGGQYPFSDPDFDGKEPGEVCRLMGRAKRWLDSRGFNIILKGTYTQVKPIKFE